MMGQSLNEAIERARKLELDGIEFYTEAARKCAHSAGARMFESFAQDERRHLEVVEKMAAGEGIDLSGVPMPRDAIRTLFSGAAEELGERVRASADEMEAVRIALDMETQSYRHYRQAAADAQDERTRSLLGRLAREENQHYEMLENTLEYLNTNAAWFLGTEWALIVGDQSSLGLQ